MDITEKQRMRLYSRCIKQPSGCWDFTGCTDRDGYGRVTICQTPMMAHRAFYICFVGSIPFGMEIHHRCENKICVNPSHMVVITRRDHTLITKNNCIDLMRSQTHCKNGHPFDDVNTCYYRTKQGWNRRMCRACSRDRTARYQKRRAA